MWNEARRDKGSAPLRELGVIDAPAPHQLILNRPGQTALRVFLHVARHVRVAPAANGYIERWPWAARVRHGRTEADRLDQLFRPARILYAQLRLAPPHAITMVFNLFG